MEKMKEPAVQCAQDESTEERSECAVEKRYTFGSYPQDGGRRNIDWLIIKEDDGRALLISEYVLDAKAFGMLGQNWESSNLRQWLNGEFLKRAFTPEQQAALCKMRCPYFKLEKKEHVPQGESEDKVTLLDVDTRQKYFGDQEELIAKATPYAQKRGVEIEDSADCCGWWLRAPLAALFEGVYAWTAYVTPNGLIFPMGITNAAIGVRPVIEIDLGKAGGCQYDMVEDDENADDAIRGIEDIPEPSEFLKKCLSSLGSTGAALEDERYPKAEPEKHLYAHYRKVQPAAPRFPGVIEHVNSGGTEFDPLDLEDVFSRIEKGENRLLNSVQNYKRADSYSLNQRATALAEVFRVDQDAFDRAHDRLCEILAGNLHKCYTLSALRSFAWTLDAMASREGRSYDDYSDEELMGIIAFAAGRKWLNYESSGAMKALCDQPDLHVLYAPDELCREVNVKRIHQCGLVRPVASLNDLRACLEALEPVMARLSASLKAGRDRKKALTGDASDVLYAWCALCIAARTPFFVEDGPTSCWWSYPSKSSAYSAFDGGDDADEDDGEEDEEPSWLSRYEQYICKRPGIEIEDKKFVLTGLGVHEDEKRYHPVVEALTAQGGLYRGSLSGVTDYLVVGGADSSEAKVRKAISLQEEGKPVKIIRLADLKAALNGEPLEDDAPPYKDAEWQERAENLRKELQRITQETDGAEKVRNIQAREREKYEERYNAVTKTVGISIEEDEALVFVFQSHIDALNLESKYTSGAVFADEFSDTFPMHSRKELIRLWNAARAADEYKRAEYKRRFMQRSLENRFSDVVVVCFNLNPAIDINEKYGAAMQQAEKWFEPEEMEKVRELLNAEQEERRRVLRAQCEPICTSWLNWSEAKRLLYVVYKDEATVQAKGALFAEIDGRTVSLYLRSEGTGQFSVMVVNWFAWYWGISPRDVWLAAYQDRFNEHGWPLQTGYVDDKTQLGDLSCMLLCCALDKMNISYQLPAGMRRPEGEEMPTAAPEKKKEGCYIATAVYGDYDAPQVRTLRRFRDDTLRKTLPGRLFIRAYYKLSPPLAARLRCARRLNALVRRALDWWVKRLERKAGR